MKTFRRADDLGVGTYVDHGPYQGEIAEVHPHGCKIGDGTIDWFTFRVREESHDGKPLPFTEAMGPYRADATIQVEAA